MITNKHRFDFAISFSGSDREIAKELSNQLKKQGFSIFLDEDYEHEMLGHDASLYLRNIYSKDSRFCIILISREYDNREWTKLERETIQARELRGERGFLLPVLVDSHKPSWLPETRIYFDLSERSLIELIVLLSRKANLTTKFGSNSSTATHFNDAEFSNKKLSNGLRKSILNFYENIKYLTVNQIDALNASLKYKHLWIEGDAGTGKTIFAIESAYRSLSAGHSVLFVYRTSQFKDILDELLRNSNAPLYTLDHNSFMWLLSLAQMHGFESDEFQSEFLNYFPEYATKEIVNPPFAKVILDDMPTYSERVHDFLDIIDLFGYQMTVISSLQQLQNGIVLETPPYNKDCSGMINEEGLDWEQYISKTDESDVVVDVISRGKLLPANHYHVKIFDTNVRNSKSISEYVSKFTNRTNKVGVVNPGMVVPIDVTLENLEHQLLDIIDELLIEFSPSSIKILVDPFFTQNRGINTSKLGVLTKFLFQAAIETDYRHSTFETLEECKNEIVNASKNNIVFMFSNGDKFGFIYDADVEKLSTGSNIKSRFLDVFNSTNDDSIQCKSILSGSALDEKIFNYNVISIYPGALYIGLESDVVIYVRNTDDMFSYFEDAPNSLMLDVVNTRNVHHYLSMTRAKFLLYDVKVSADTKYI